ncbi:MAG: glycosyltransferase family 39 protein [Calditerrivibrio sp.]|nr:glycosyltransferase family 39 protein [Calditerrivibrio sp.]
MEFSFRRRKEYYHIIVLIGYIISISTFVFLPRDLFFGDEVRYADVYTHLKDGNFIALTLNGQPYPDKPPIFFIFIYLVQLITGFSSTRLFFLATSMSAVMFIIASYFFLRLLLENADEAFYSNLLICCNLYFVALVNFVKMDLLFSFFIIISLSFFYKFYLSYNKRYLYTAFLSAGIAVMVKGLLGIIFPLFSFVIFVILKRRYKVITNLHFILGIFLSLLPTLVWIISLIKIYGFTYVYDSIFYQQTIRRAIDAFHSKKPFYFYTYVLPLIWLPFTLGFIIHLKKLNHIFGDFFSRLEDGKLFLTVVFFVVFLVLSIISSKFANYLLPLFPSFSVFIYYILLKGNKANLIWTSSSVIFLLICITLIYVYFKLDQFGFLFKHEYFLIIPFVLFLMFFITYFMKGYDLKKSISIYAISILIFTNVLNLFFISKSGIFFSPRQLAEELSKYSSLGYVAISFDTYSGTYSYYAGRSVFETRDKELVFKKIDMGEKLVIALPEKTWNKWEIKPKNTKIIQKYWMMNKYYLVILAN